MRTRPTDSDPAAEAVQKVDVFHLLDDLTYIVYNPSCEPGDQVNGDDDAYCRVGRTYQPSPRLSL